MKIKHNIYIALLTLLISIAVFLLSLYNFGLSKVSNDNTLKKVVIEKGSINQVASTLYEKHFIRSKLAFKIYVKIHRKHNLMAATYELSQNMGTRKIVDILSKGKKAQDDVKITFKEGINMRTIANIIEKHTNNKEEDVYNLLKDENYLNKIINKYWFLNNDIKNSNIYYSLEGYLYPNTYSLRSKDSTVEEIFEQMLDETNRQLKKHQSVIEKNSLSLHQILTLASIVELEGTTVEERKKIARVFMNRMASNMNLGSDVTTYYGAKINMGERDLYSEEVTSCNNYNTRCATFKTLPISPICSSSIEAIEAVLTPDDNDYYYFVADKNKKIYFSRTQKEHTNTINKLKKSGLWYEY
ncbi:MAG: endolytic transglycosylase MltG [Bacilli bacterium]|nr:endolytic transglycosylase MltG [Bacilli bacterium]